MSEVPAEPRELKRSLSLWQVTASGVGIVIGAGIYALIGPATEHAGTAVWLSFLLAAVLSGLTGLSYAELAGMFPSAGAEYAFARQAFNKTAGFLAGWLMISANVIAAAAVSIGFAHYLRTFVSVDTRLAALCLLAVFTAVIAVGVQRSIWLSLALVVCRWEGSCW
jgi:amino acid transporter